MPTIRDLNQEASEQIVRGQLRKIVEIYDLEWRVLHELVQNALDAIQNNPRVADDGRVEVLLDFDEDTVNIVDNGTGFTFNLELLTPGGTGAEKEIRRRSPSKGYQGVGLKAVMYSTDSFMLESQTGSTRWEFACDGLREYIQPESEENPEYYLDSEEQENDDTYTRIIASFPEGTLADVFQHISDRHLDPDSVRWQRHLYQHVIDDDPDQAAHVFVQHFLGWYLRTFSYTGCYNALLGVPVRNRSTGELEEMKAIDIEVVLRSANGFRSLDGPLGEWLEETGSETIPISVPYRAWDYAQIAVENSKLQARYRRAPDVVTIKPHEEEWDDFKPTFQDKLLALRLTPNESAEDFRTRYEDYIGILERPRSPVDAGDFEDVFEAITGIYLVIGRTVHFETLGVENRGQRMIASNGTPTAHDLTVRTTSSTWYLETIHMIINVDSTLNVGKRHLANTRLVGRINDFVSSCYPRLVQISKLFVEKESRGAPNGDMPAVIDRPRLAREGIPFRRFPTDETGLIGIFTALIPHVDPGFSAFGYFGRAVYDGKFLWTDEEPRSDAELNLLEFKVEVDELVKEFSQATHDKEFQEVSLVIVWDRDISFPGWDVKGLSVSRRGSLEDQGVPTDLVDYVLEDSQGNYRPLICVADLLTQRPVIEGREDDLDDFVRQMH